MNIYLTEWEEGETMEVIKQHKGLIAIAALLVLVIGVSAINSDDQNSSATNNDSSSETTTTEKPADKDEKAPAKNQSSDDSTQPNTDAESTADTYNYVAQPGDSYSVLARKAVQTYGLVNNVRLSLAEIIAAETKLTQDANADSLEIGQRVSFNVAAVKEAMDYAQDLSPEDKAAWESYVPYVQFDTRSFGE